MNRFARQIWAWGGLSLRAILRRRSTWVWLVLAIAATASGGVFAPFDFGGRQGEFLLSISWALRVAVVVVIAVGLSVQLVLLQEEEGLVPVALGRGISPIVLMFGSVAATTMVVSVVAVVTGVVAGLTGVGTGGGLVMSAIMLTLIGILVAFLVQWMGSMSGAAGFLIGGSLGIIALGFLRPVAVDVGGGAAWFAMLAPDFAWLGEFNWSAGRAGWGEAGRAIGSSVIYLAVLGWLAARAMGRREY